MALSLGMPIAFSQMATIREKMPTSRMRKDTTLAAAKLKSSLKTFPEDLKTKIPKLDDIISSHAHLLTGSTIYYRGGLHDILFLLKSFDLDIRMGYPLGTVFGYGRADEFKDCEYISN